MAGGFVGLAVVAAKNKRSIKTKERESQKRVEGVKYLICEERLLLKVSVGWVILFVLKKFQVFNENVKLLVGSSCVSANVTLHER